MQTILLGEANACEPRKARVNTTGRTSHDWLCHSVRRDCSASHLVLIGLGFCLFRSLMYVKVICFLHAFVSLMFNA